VRAPGAAVGATAAVVVDARGGRGPRGRGAAAVVVHRGRRRRVGGGHRAGVLLALRGSRRRGRARALRAVRAAAVAAVVVHRGRGRARCRPRTAGVVVTSVVDGRDCVVLAPAAAVVVGGGTRGRVDAVVVDGGRRGRRPIDAVVVDRRGCRRVDAVVVDRRGHGRHHDLGVGDGRDRVGGRVRDAAEQRHGQGDETDDEGVLAHELRLLAWGGRLQVPPPAVGATSERWC